MSEHLRARPRVALVYKSPPNYRGVYHVGLGITASNTARALRRAGIAADVWPCSKAEHIAERLRHASAPPTHVVLHAPWVPPDVLSELAAKFPDVVFTTVSHSNVAFLSVDPEAVRYLRETADLQQLTHNVRVAGNCEKFSLWASEAWTVPVACLPNLYDLGDCPLRPAPELHGTLRLGLFGANRQMKNWLTAAGAAVLLAQRLRLPTELHVSMTSEEFYNDRALHALTVGVHNLQVVCAGWMYWPAFRRAVGHMHLLLQPSFTESFNVVTADGIAASVPSVVSSAISWAPDDWIADSDDACDIARVAERLLSDPTAVLRGRHALIAYVARGLRAWDEFLRS